MWGDQYWKTFEYVRILLFLLFVQLGLMLNL